MYQALYFIGELLSRISVGGIEMMYDLQITGSTLTLLKSFTKKVEFYQLK